MYNHSRKNTLLSFLVRRVRPMVTRGQRDRCLNNEGLEFVSQRAEEANTLQSVASVKFAAFDIDERG